MPRKLIDLANNILAAHIHSERLRNPDGTIRIQVVLQERNEHPGRCNHRIVQRMRQVLFPVCVRRA